VYQFKILKHINKNVNLIGFDGQFSTSEDLKNQQKIKH